MLILSPNKVFADYIGNVLPELGEETVPEIGMETLARQILGDKIRFQTFFEQTSLLLDKDDAAMKDRIRAKASPDFLRKLQAYAVHVEVASFQPTDLTLRRRPVPGFLFAREWTRFKDLATNQRLSETANSVIVQVNDEYNIELRKEERAILRTHLKSMVRRTTLRNAYKEFFDWIDRPELFRPVSGKLEYADVFPLIYLQILLEGVNNPYPSVKHLLVDEMQDYTPVHYAVLAKLFPCRKTILGDATQSVNPYTASHSAQIAEVLAGATQVTLNKSYRSTYQIMQFALKISPNPDLIAMERNGPEPQVHVVPAFNDMVEKLKHAISEFHDSDHSSLAILAKTQSQASKLHQALQKAGVTARLLEESSSGFSTGVLICTPHLAKGLEFDHVVIADVSADTYATEMDRNLLYVACTRAMHRLTLVSVAQPSSFIDLAARDAARS